MSALDPVQVEALKFAEGKPGVGFFIEQGIGKSLIALAEFNRLYHENLVDRAIIICPNTFKRGWVDEIEKHNFRFDLHVFRAIKRQEASTFASVRHERPPVFIVNYEAARLPSVIAGMCKWALRGRCYLVIDESIQIKGHKSAQTKAILKLADWSPYTGEPLIVRYVRILTGRPTTQGPHDLWGQLRAIGLFRTVNFYAFRGAFCIMGGWMAKEVVQAKNTEKLAEIMAPVVFQAKKKDWLPNLPRKDATIRDYVMSKDQQRQYDQMERDFLLYLENDVVTVEVAIAKYEKLAQIQTGFIYDEEHVAHELVAIEDNPRIDLMRQILEDEITGKACVVYRHRPMLTTLIKALAHYDPTWIKGGMKPDEVEENKARFNTDPDCRVILLQAEASKYGHTILGGPGEDDLCRTMIFFENSYSADTRDQIEDRIHRRGQTGEYVSYIDLSGSELDRRIVRALQRKNALYRSVFKNLKVAEPA